MVSQCLSNVRIDSIAACSLSSLGRDLHVILDLIHALQVILQQK